MARLKNPQRTRRLRVSLRSKFPNNEPPCCVRAARSEWGETGRLETKGVLSLWTATPKPERSKHHLIEIVGDPSRIRTCNPRSRNPLLYPVELWDRWRLYNIANMKNPLCRQARSEPFSATKRQSPKRWTVSVPQRNAAPRPAFGAAEGSLRQMSHATFSHSSSTAMSPSPFKALLLDTRRSSAQGVPS